MAWNNLKATIAAVVKTNGNQEITGALLQQTLHEIVNKMGANATFKGVATPSTTPGNPDGVEFYLSSSPGTYPNFSGTVVKGISVFSNASGSWIATEILDVSAYVKSSDISNVENTKDIDKPVSSATQTKLNLKEDLSNKQNDLTADPTNKKYTSVTAVRNAIAPIQDKQNTLEDDLKFKIGSDEEEVVATDLNALYQRILSLESLVRRLEFDRMTVAHIDVLKGLKFNGYDLFKKGTTAPGLSPDGVPQFYINTTNGDLYSSKNNSSVSDWVLK